MSDLTNEYEQDFYKWTIRNAQLLRDGNFQALDIDHLANEIENMGASERRELRNRLEVLIAHLLKLQYLQSCKARNQRVWKITVREQRRRIQECLRYNPSLKSSLLQCFEESIPYAIDELARQEEIDETTLPATCPFTLAQVLDDNFYP